MYITPSSRAFFSAASSETCLPLSIMEVWTVEIRMDVKNKSSDGKQKQKQYMRKQDLTQM